MGGAGDKTDLPSIIIALYKYVGYRKINTHYYCSACSCSSSGENIRLANDLRFPERSVDAGQKPTKSPTLGEQVDRLIA